MLVDLENVSAAHSGNRVARTDRGGRVAKPKHIAMADQIKKSTNPSKIMDAKMAMLILVLVTKKADLSATLERITNDYEHMVADRAFQEQRILLLEERPVDHTRKSESIHFLLVFLVNRQRLSAILRSSLIFSYFFSLFRFSHC